jgi:LemA protein
MRWLILVIVAALVFYVISLYNRMVRLKFRVKQAWSDVDVQLKRRYDLIPNLVETVKGYAAHEWHTLEKVIEARSRAMGASTPSQRAETENILQSTLKSLFALVERYPNLKANENFMALQSSLSEIEEQIQLSRRYYNAVVRDMNSMTEAFPTNIVAQMFGFKPFDYFQLPLERERGPVRISF